MKKNILLLIVVCLFAIEKINAQGDEAQESKVEEKKEDKLEKFSNPFVSGRVLFSQIRGQSQSYSDPVTGVGIGVYLPAYILPKGNEVIFGIAYTIEGSKYESSQYIPGGMEKKVENVVRLSYLRLPLYYQLKTPGGFYANAGLQPGFLFSANDKHDGQSDNIKSDYNSFDLGMIFGVGYQFKGHVGVNANFMPGISNINKKGGPNDGKKDRNSSISFGAHYVL